MAERWENEWRTQHHGEPMPSFGKLEKMHRGEIQNNINTAFTAMRARRQQELARNKGWARDLYAKQIGKPGGALTAAEEQGFNRSYQAAQLAEVESYKNAQRQAADHWESEHEEQERRKIFHAGY